MFTVRMLGASHQGEFYQDFTVVCGEMVMTVTNHFLTAELATELFILQYNCYYCHSYPLMTIDLSSLKGYFCESI